MKRKLIVAVALISLIGGCILLSKHNSKSNSSLEVYHPSTKKIENIEEYLGLE